MAVSFIEIGVLDGLFTESRVSADRPGDCFVTLIMISWDDPITPEAMQAAAEAPDFARLANIES